MRSSTDKFNKLHRQVQNDFSFCTFSVFVSSIKMFDTSKVSMIYGGRVNDKSDE